ncbi:hypothetical protein Tco_1337966 [Tanacetum coccineum]
MVAYLKKPTRSEGFQEIVDFLNGSHIRYALTKSPTIYVSLIKKFWQTATVRTVDNGEQEITATIDGKEFTITEASVRRHLQLADVDGSGHPSEPQPPPSTTQPTHAKPIPNVVSSSHQKTQPPRQALNQVTELPQTSEPIPNVPDEAVYEKWDDRVERATTTAASLDAEQASGGSPRCQEAMGGSIAQTRIDGFMYNIVQESGELRGRLEVNKEDDEEDLEDSSKQGRMIEEIDQDAGVTLVTPTHSQEDQPEDQLGVFSAAKVLADAAKENVHTYTRRRRAVSTGSGRISTAEESVNTVGASMPVVIKDKGKAKMDESEPEQTKTKLQQRQERAGYEAAVRLQEQLDEEERKRIARVHEEASSFNIEEWEDIQAKIEADEELAQRIQAEEREKYSEAEKARLLAELINQRKRYFAQQRAEERRNKPLTQAQQRTYMSNYIKHMGSHTLQQLKKLSFDELNNLFKATMRRAGAFVPMETEIRREVPELAARSSKRDAEEELDQGSSKRQKTNPTEDKEIELWVELKRLFEPDVDDELWKSQKHIYAITYRIYDTCRVHHVSTKDGIDIYMLVQKEYPLSRGVLTQMLAAKLLVEQNNEMSRELLRKIFMMAERPRRKSVWKNPLKV